MLELGGGIGLGVEVADLLELQCTFYRDRMTRRPTDIECVLGVAEAFGKAGNLVLAPEDGGDVIR